MKGLAVQVSLIIFAVLWTFSECYNYGIIQRELRLNATCPSGNILLILPNIIPQFGEYLEGSENLEPMPNVQLSIAFDAFPQKSLFRFNQTCDLIASLDEPSGFYGPENLAPIWTFVTVYGGPFIGPITLGLISREIQDMLLQGELQDWNFPYNLSFDGNEDIKNVIKLSRVGLPDIIWEESGDLTFSHRWMTGP